MSGSGLLQPLQHIGNVDGPPGEQLLQRNPFGRDLRMQGKRRPANGDLEFLFQSFNTPGNEVAPGSDEIRKNFQDMIFSGFIHFPSP
jgi:hypothetical protein